MTDADRNRRLRETTRLLIACVRRLPGALARMHKVEGSLRSTRTDGSRAGGLADPTGAAALVIDGASRDLRSLDRLLGQLYRAAVDLHGVLVSYPDAHQAGEADRLALARANIVPDPGCANCARLEGPDGRPRWEPADLRVSGPTTAGGVLAEPMVLCSWCRNRLDLWGRLPSEAELTRHHQGQRVPWPSDVPRPDA